MKKILLTCTAVFICQPAYAEMKPYVGVDLQRVSLDYNDNYDIGGGAALDGNSILDDSLDGLNVHVGARCHKNVGFELGYFRTKEEGEDTDTGDSVGPGTVAATDFSTDVQMQGLTLDALGYLPLQRGFELIGTAGISYTKADLNLTVPGVGGGEVDDKEFGYRLGAGAQYNINEQINIRGIARYQSADFDSVVDNAWVYTLGANYSF